MRNIPFFDTQYGVASLVLKEIPYTQTAYITVHETQELPRLLEECVDFCRAVGAEHIYAKGHEDLAVYPVYMQVLQMAASTNGWDHTDGALTPVTEENLQSWCDIYNKRMSQVDNAAYMTALDARKLLKENSAFFVTQNGQTVAILLATEGKLLALASIRPGGGRNGLLALKAHFQWEQVILEVASTNHRAIALYKELGFETKSVLSQWHKIL